MQQGLEHGPFVLRQGGEGRVLPEVGGRLGASGLGEADGQAAAVFLAAAAGDEALGLQLTQKLADRGAAQLQQADKVCLAHVPALGQQAEHPLTAAGQARAVDKIVSAAAHEAAETVPVRLRLGRVGPPAPRAPARTVRAGAVGAVLSGKQSVTYLYRRSAELGYWLGREFWGRGIMPAAVEEMCRLGFHRWDIVRIFAEPYAHNAASRRVLEKAGFALEGVMRCGIWKNGRLRDYCMYALLRPETP